MAKKTNNKLKEILLISFLIISVALVAFQWVDGIIGEPQDTSPAFVRPTMENFEVDEDAYKNWNQLEATPTHQHHRTLMPENTPTH